MPVNTRKRKIPATLTEEQEWQTDVPNIKLSRAFLIFLLLHIVAVAGILIFNMMKEDEAIAATADKDSNGGEATANTSYSPSKRRGSAAWRDDSAPARLDLNKPKYRGLIHHQVRTGDSLRTIAAEHAVSERELANLNRLSDNDLLRVGDILVIPGRKLIPSLPDELRDMRSTASNVPGKPVPDVPTEVAPPAPAPRKKIVSEPPAPAPVPKKSIVAEKPELKPVPPVVIERPAPAPKKKKAVAVTPPAPEEVVKPKPTPPAAKPKPDVKPKPGATRTYVMKRGDNPFRVAKKYGINYRDLLRFNGISEKNASNIPVGKVLKIPGKQ